MKSLPNEPLVSILIPNYNYGHFLRHCLDSVISQTYKNIEVIIQDNASTDNSYEIILEYQLKAMHGEIEFPIYADRNRRNLGSDRNATICSSKAEGKYLLFLSSDDALKPEYVERCVAIMEENSRVSMVMVHRDEIDDDGNVHPTPPFYNKSFVCDGESQAAVFMMAGIAVPTQVLLRAGSCLETSKYRFYQLQVAGDWYSNYLMACVGDIAYIKDALCEYRVHFGNETNESEKNLLGVFEHFLLINAFNSIAKSIGYQKPQDKYDSAVQKLGGMCLRYTLKMLQNKEIECAKKYLYLAVVFDEEIKNDKRYAELWDIVTADHDFDEKLSKFEKENVLIRTISYDPPEGYVEIDFENDQD